MGLWPESQLNRLKENNRFRELKAIEKIQLPYLWYQGERYLDFSSNDYLGLSQHSELINASQSAIKKWGTSARASQLIVGHLDFHQNLQKQLAGFKKSQAALVFNSGYQANLALSCLLEQDDWVLSDKLNHASLIDGIRLSGAKKIIVQHNDLNDWECQLMLARQRMALQKESKAKIVMVVDSVFSMDGDLAPVLSLLELAKRYNAFIYFDQAHATGVFENEIACVPNALDNPFIIQMGTFSKALGSFGAYLAAHQSVIDLFINKARSFIYTTALPASVIAANSKALEMVMTQPELKNQLWQNISFFEQELKTHLPKNFHWPSWGHSPIFVILCGSNQNALTLDEYLKKHGFWGQAIRPPTVAKGSARVRLTLTAKHSQEQLKSLVKFLVDGLQELKCLRSF